MAEAAAVTMPMAGENGPASSEVRQVLEEVEVEKKELGSQEETTGAASQEGGQLEKEMIARGDTTADNDGEDHNRVTASGDVTVEAKGQTESINDNGIDVVRAPSAGQDNRPFEGEKGKSADDLRAEDDRPQAPETVLEVASASKGTSGEAVSKERTPNGKEEIASTRLPATTTVNGETEAPIDEKSHKEVLGENAALTTGESESMKRKSTPKRELLRPPLPGSSSTKSRRRNRRDDETEICQVCGDWQGAAQMLLCDGCDEGFHIYCLNPPLAEVPDGDWFCPYCAAERAKVTNASPKSKAKGGKQGSTKGKDDGKKKQAKKVDSRKDNEKVDTIKATVGETSTLQPKEQKKPKKSPPKSITNNNEQAVSNQTVSSVPVESKATQKGSKAKKEMNEKSSNVSEKVKDSGAKEEKKKRSNNALEEAVEKAKKVKTVTASPKVSSNAASSAAAVNPMHSLTMAAAAAQHQQQPHQPQAAQYNPPLTQQQLQHIHHLQQQQAMIAAQHRQQQQYQPHPQMLGHHHQHAAPPGYYFYGPPPPQHQIVSQGPYPAPGRAPQQQWISSSQQPSAQHPQQSRAVSVHPPPPPPMQSAGKATDKRG